MKTNPFLLIVIAAVLVTLSVVGVIKFAVIPLSSEHSKLQAEFDVTVDKLKDMTEKFETAKKYVQKEQDRMDIDCLNKYINKVTSNLSPVTIQEVTVAAVKYSREFGVPIELIVGIIHTESAFNPTAFNKTGARGVMQVIARYHKERILEFVGAPKNLHTPEIGIKAGTTILSHYLEQVDGDLSEALFRYNGTNGKKDVYATEVYNLSCKYSIVRSAYFLEHDAVLDTVNVMETKQEETSVKTQEAVKNDSKES